MVSGVDGQVSVLLVVVLPAVDALLLVDQEGGLLAGQAAAAPAAAEAVRVEEGVDGADDLAAAHLLAALAAVQVAARLLLLQDGERDWVQ